MNRNLIYQNKKMLSMQLKFNKLYIFLVRITLRPIVLYLIYFIILVTLNIIYMEPIYAMHRDENTIKLALEAHQLGNENAARLFLENLNQVTDSERVARIIIILNNLAQQHGIIFDNIHINDGTITIANSGIPYPMETERSWRPTITAIGLFIGISFLGYFICRNLDTVRDILFDVGHRVIDMIPHNVMIERATYLVRDPGIRNELINILIQQGLIHGGIGGGPAA